MQDDFTLVVPTFNRSSDLRLLISYLQAQSAKFKILVLDSSKNSERAENKKIAKAAGLAIEYHEFDVETHPFDKFRAGIKIVETPFCSLCADDDIPLLEGILKSVDRLKEDPTFSVAHGYYFQFAHQPNAINLSNITYYTPSIEDADPVGRVHTLMRHYQALTYGVYRTPVLQHIFDAVRPVTSLLGRELLSSALAVVQGKIARVNCFYMGRNLGPSSGHVHWHPLEWSIKSPEALFAEYVRYREILIREIRDRPDNKRAKEDIARLLDLIHLHYYVRHAPEESLDFAINEVSAGHSADEIFGAPEVTYPLIEAAARYSAREKLAAEKCNAEARAPVRATTPQNASFHIKQIVSSTPTALRIRHAAMQINTPLAPLPPLQPGETVGARSVAARVPGVRRLKRTFTQLTGPIPDHLFADQEETEKSEPVTLYVSTQQRDYILQQDFHTPPQSNGVQLTQVDRETLLEVLDAYAHSQD